jgi:hypothetical protein
MHVGVMRRTLLLICLAAPSFLVSACSAPPKQPHVYTNPITEKDSIEIAQDYLKERKATTPDDQFYPRRYQGGWIVHVERYTGYNSRLERVVEPGSARLLKIDNSGKVVEFLPGATTPQEPEPKK